MENIENKQCENCGMNFALTEQDMEFYSQIAPVINNQKYNMPVSKECPNCSQQKRLAFTNERKIYKRKCDKSESPIIALYGPDSEYKVYKQSERRGDDWNPMEYMKEYDFERPFFEQFEALTKAVPRTNLLVVSSENCEYNNAITNSKNSYLCFSSDNLENCCYVSASGKIQNSVDIWWSHSVDNSCECFSCANMYKCFFCSNCSDCSNLILSEECSNCSDCIMCFGLVNKSFCIKNKQYEKAEYDVEKAKYYVGSYIQLLNMKKEFEEFANTLPHNSTHSENNENSFGDYIYNNKNCKNCFNTIGMSDSKDVFEGGRTSNIYNSNFVYNGEGKVYNSILISNCFNVIFSEGVIDSSSIMYSSQLTSCENCFGCFGLDHKQHCIFNKQYAKEEYDDLIPKIISHMQSTNEWGQFFPVSISPFGYNETVAQEYFPLDRAQAINNGFKWQDKEYPINVPPGTETINAQDLPDNIADIQDDILKKAIICEISSKPFRVTKSELEFYKKLNISLPRRHPDQRHFDRMTKRNPRKLFFRNCKKCSCEIKSTYSLKRPEIVYCENCYVKEVYG